MCATGQQHDHWQHLLLPGHRMLCQSSAGQAAQAQPAWCAHLLSSSPKPVHFSLLHASPTPLKRTAACATAQTATHQAQHHLQSMIGEGLLRAVCSSAARRPACTSQAPRPCRHLKQRPAACALGCNRTATADTIAARASAGSVLSVAGAQMVTGSHLLIALRALLCCFVCTAAAAAPSSTHPPAACQQVQPLALPQRLAPRLATGGPSDLARACRVGAALHLNRDMQGRTQMMEPARARKRGGMRTSEGRCAAQRSERRGMNGTLHTMFVFSAPRQP